MCKTPIYMTPKNALKAIFLSLPHNQCKVSQYLQAKKDSIHFFCSPSCRTLGHLHITLLHSVHKNHHSSQEKHAFFKSTYNSVEALNCDSISKRSGFLSSRICPTGKTAFVTEMTVTFPLRFYEIAPLNRNTHSHTREKHPPHFDQNSKRP